jgi:hypothetical protein
MGAEIVVIRLLDIFDTDQTFFAEYPFTLR